MPTKPIIAMTGSVTIDAEEASGDKKPPRKFTAEFYTGGALEVDGWDMPIVVDLAGLDNGKVLVANLDHDRTKRVGNFAVANNGATLVANGTASARTAARDEVVGSAEDGYQWQASLEVQPREIETIKKGQTAEANGRTFDGPVHIARTGVLKGFAFVSHGADDNTSATIAARAAQKKEQRMTDDLKAWIESLGFVAADLTEQQIANLTADFEGRDGKRQTIAAASPKDGFEKKRIEAERRKQISALATEWMDAALESDRYDDVERIKEARDEAIKAGQSVSDFRYELRIATMADAPPRIHSASHGISDKVLEAAVCQAGQLNGYEKLFDDKTLQEAHSKYKGRISLRELYATGAAANGYHGRVGAAVDTDMHNAAFGLAGNGSRLPIRASGFSTISLPNVFSNVANKFLREGWNAVDQTPLRIAAIRSVSDFKAVTTVSLTGGLQFEPIGPDGEIKHGEVSELTYSNQVSPAGVMFAITFVDIRNDNLGALTAVPRKIGRGGMLYLNHIFWSEFLNNSAFFTSGRSNVNEGVANMTVGGLAATETVFMSQTDADGKPLGSQPAILLVPTALNSAARTLMASERLIDGTATGTQGDANIWRGRFRVESSPYMHNSTYTGYSAAAWYMLADPSDIPVIEIAALDGQVQPTVETADASFNVLGVQMRGHSHVGVSLQEYRGGVRADGGAS